MLVPNTAQQIIKDKVVVNDDWTILRLTEEQTPDSVVIPEGKIIVPLKVWQAQRDSLQGRKELGVWFASDERPEALKDELKTPRRRSRSSPSTSPSSPMAVVIQSPTTCAPASATPANCGQSAMSCAISCSTCSASASMPSPCVPTRTSMMHSRA